MSFADQSVEPWVAEFPFLEAAQEQVNNLDISIQEIGEENNHPVAERAVERVRTAITDQHTNPVQSDDTDRASHIRLEDELDQWLTGHGYDPVDWDACTVELMSYPVARLLVSALDETIAVNRYIRAEAATAQTRLQNGQTGTTGRFSTDQQFLSSLGVAEAVRQTNNNLWDVRVSEFLRFSNAAWETSNEQSFDWRLTSRGFEDGWVSLNQRNEFSRLLRGAITDRIGRDLPFEVPDGVASLFEAELAELEPLVESTDRPMPSHDTPVVPDEFPDVVADAVANPGQATKEQRVVAVLFLSSFGLSPAEVVEMFDVDSSGAAGNWLKTLAETFGGENGRPVFSVPSYDALDAVGVDVPSDTDAVSPVETYLDAVETDN